MPKASTIKLGGRLKIMLISINGGGKTRQAASFLHLSPVATGYIFDFDNRLATVAKDYPNDLDRIEYDTWGLSNFQKFDRKLQELQKSCPYDFVVLDSITAFATTAVLYSLGESGGKMASGFNVPSFDEYAVETTIISKTLEVLKELPCHVIVNAHPVARLEMGAKKDDKKISITKVSQIVTYGAKLSSIIPNYLDEVYCLQEGTEFDGSKKRLCKTQTDEDSPVLAKTSLPLPATMDLTNKFLLDVLREELAKNNITIAEKREQKSSSQVTF